MRLKYIYIIGIFYIAFDLSKQLNTLLQAFGPQLSTGARCFPGWADCSDEAWLAARSGVWVAAVHGGAGHIRVGRDQLALGQVQDIRNIVAKSVSPRLSGKTEIKCYFLMFAEVTFTCGPVDWHHKDYGRRWMSVFLWVFYESPGWGSRFPHRMPEWTLGDNDLRISASPWRINYK